MRCLIEMPRRSLDADKSSPENAMSHTLKSLGIDRLSVEERMRLLEEIWDSIAEEQPDLPLTEAQRQDLDRRIDAYEANPNAGSPWEEVKARLLEKQ
ncbi:MAG: addiction module protein [Gemmataceae bacterium]